MKTIITSLVIMLAFGYSFGIDKEKTVIEAEKNFIKDMGNGLHKYKPNKQNKCPYHISSIAYGFSWQESNLGSFGMSIYTKNRTSIHPGGKYYYKWKKKWGSSCKGECLRNYQKPIQSVIDFMYLYKYSYGCKLDQPHITYYIRGNKPTNKHTIEYRKNLIKKIEYFENKYFK